MFLVRQAKTSDINALYELSKNFDTVNLPANRDVIESIVQHSIASFVSTEQDNRRLLFVLENLESKEVVGCSMTIAQHGTYEKPATYFKVVEKQKYSPLLKKHFRHETLELTFDYDGPTELGGLVLSPSLRGNPFKLGRYLSYARLALIALRPSWFQQEIVAELLPPLGPNRESQLWEYLGERFTQLDYQTADKLSRENIHFILELFPQVPLYTSLLPKEIQAQIGEVGPDSQPAAHLLSKIGFKYDQTIDPFDGGPTYRVNIHDCSLIQNLRLGRWAGDVPTHANSVTQGFLCLDHIDQTGDFLILQGKGYQIGAEIFFDFQTTEIEKKSTQQSLLSQYQIPLKKGDHVAFLPFEV